jgi:hypothetical protein
MDLNSDSLKICKNLLNSGQDDDRTAPTVQNNSIGGNWTIQIGKMEKKKKTNQNFLNYRCDWFYHHLDQRSEDFNIF